MQMKRACVPMYAAKCKDAKLADHADIAKCPSFGCPSMTISGFCLRHSFSIWMHSALNTFRSSRLRPRLGVGISKMKTTTSVLPARLGGWERE